MHVSGGSSRDGSTHSPQIGKCMPMKVFDGGGVMAALDKVPGLDLELAINRSITTLAQCSGRCTTIRCAYMTSARPAIYNNKL